MEWITQVQRDVGTPVVDFALSNWGLVLVALALGGWWLYAATMGGSTSIEIAIADDLDADGGGEGGGD